MSKIIWNLDPSHSEVRFKVKHLGISSVSGGFDVISAEIQSDDEQFSNTDISFTADTASVNTNAADRDKHLRSADFFDTENYPEIRFEAKGVDLRKDNVEGDLTIRGKSLPVTLDVEFEVAKDPWGVEKAVFSLSGKVKRSEWGLNWNAALETGGFLVSNDVKILCEVQFVRQS